MASASVRGVHERLSVELAAGRCRGLHGAPSVGSGTAGVVDDPRLPGAVGPVLRVSCATRATAGSRSARIASGPIRCRCAPSGTGPATSATTRVTRAAGRSRRRSCRRSSITPTARSTASGVGTQGCAGCVPRCCAAEGRLRLGAAPSRGRAARRRRPASGVGCAVVRDLRRAACAVGQGKARRPAPAPDGALGVRLGRGGVGPVRRGGPPGVRVRRPSRPMGDRARVAPVAAGDR